MKSQLFRCCALVAACFAGLPAGFAANSKPVVAMLAKAKGNAYFVSCGAGAERAAQELGVDLLFDGPIDGNAAKQAEIVENWIARGVDVIAAAVEDKEGLSVALRKAQSRGIKVVTYDADAMPDARSFFVNQATAQGIAYGLMDEAAQLTGSEGEFAVITASLLNDNQREWMRNIEARLKEKYPRMTLVATRPCDDRRDLAQSESTAIMNAHPNLKLIMAICSPGVPGAAEAVKRAGKAGTVKVIGLGLPNENRSDVHEGVTDSVILWKTEDLGYLTIFAAMAVAKGDLRSGATSFKAGTLGTFEIQGDNILLGQPFVFNKTNIDQFNF